MMKKIKVEPQFELTEQQKQRNISFLQRLEKDLTSLMNLLETSQIGLTGYMLAVSYTTLDNSNTGAFGLSGNVDKILDIVDRGLIEVSKEEQKNKADRLSSGGKIH